MKKIIKSAFILALCLLSLFNIEAFALENNDIEVKNIVLSQEEINEILAKGNTYTAKNRASDLIFSATAAINNDFKLLQFVGSMTCSSDVVKCGFENITVQRRASSSASWSNYYQFDDDIADGTAKTTIKAVTTNTGYEYRVICTAYAKKSLFSVQRVSLTTNIIAW